MSVFEEEIDLRQYVAALVQHWRRLFIFAILTAAAALAWSLFAPEVYDATATVLLTRVRADLSLSGQFPTVAEPIDARSRLDAILSIARSDAVSYTAYAQIRDRLPPEYANLVDLIDRLEIRANGDAILFGSRLEDPELAALVANAWAQEATRATNLAYSGEQPLNDIENQLQIAREEFDAAQSALEEFITVSEVAVLELQIGESENLLERLSDDKISQITFFDDRKHLMENIIVQAEGLRAQLQRGNQSSAGEFGDALAVLLARAEAMGVSTSASMSISGNAPSIELQLSNLESLQSSEDSFAADLEALIEQARIELQKAESALEGLASEVVDPAEVDVLAAAATRLQTLETRLEEQQALERELTSDRDLAWEAYQALAQKEVEIKTSAPASERITVAAVAVPPIKPESRGALVRTVLGGVIGLLLGAIWVIAAEWWKHQSAGLFDSGKSGS